MKRSIRLLLVALITAAALAAGLVSNPASAWAPAGEATIHPGVQTFTGTAQAQCTANFIFKIFKDDGSTGSTYIGQAAHCSSTGGVTETQGCLGSSLPLGTPVTVAGASQPGRLAYNSWLAMKAKGETDQNTCAYNDFALIELHQDDVAKVNPSIPHWGGPTGLNTAGVPLFQTVYSYGNSSLRGGLTPLSPKFGISLGTAGGGWTHPVYAATPGIPGDSGSAFLDAKGRALGVLSTIVLAPLAASNGVSDLSRALEYMRKRGGPTATLVLGTEAFTPLPLGL